MHITKKFRHAKKIYLTKITKQNFSACQKIFLRRHMKWSYGLQVKRNIVENRLTKAFTRIFTNLYAISHCVPLCYNKAVNFTKNIILQREMYTAILTYGSEN